MATLGKTAVGGTSFVFDANATGGRRGDIYQAAASGTITDLKVYLQGGTSNQTLRSFVYNATDGTTPGSFISVGTETTVLASAAAAWVTFAATGSLVAGNFYCFGLWGSGTTTGAVGFYDTVGTQMSRTIGNVYSSSSSPADPFGVSSGGTQEWSMYVDFTPSAVPVSPDGLDGPVVWDLLGLRRN